MFTKERLEQAYAAVFDDSENARIVMADLLKFGHVFDQLHTPGDPNHTAHLDGRRRVVLRVLSLSGRRDDIVDLVAYHPAEQPREAEDE